VVKLLDEDVRTSGKMVKTPTFLTFEEYLKYDDGTDNRYELVNGNLVKVPPESENNNWIALWLRDELIAFVGKLIHN